MSGCVCGEEERRASPDSSFIGHGAGGWRFRAAFDRHICWLGWDRDKLAIDLVAQTAFW